MKRVWKFRCAGCATQVTVKTMIVRVESKGYVPYCRECDKTKG